MQHALCWRCSPRWPSVVRRPRARHKPERREATRATGSGGSATGNGGSGAGTGAGGSGTTGAGGSGTTGSGGTTTGAGTTTGTGSGTTTGAGGATTGSGGATTTTGTGGATTGTTRRTRRRRHHGHRRRHTGSGGATTTTGTGGATTGTTTGTGGTTTGSGGTGGAGGSGGTGGGPAASTRACPMQAAVATSTPVTSATTNASCPRRRTKGFRSTSDRADYKNPEAQYLLQPGQEVTNDISAGNSPNTPQVYFFYRQFRMRPTAHHIIISAPNGSDVGRRIGTANKSEDYPTGRRHRARGQGHRHPARAEHAHQRELPRHQHDAPNRSCARSGSTSGTATRAEVTQPATEWFETGSTTFAIPPHTKTVLGPYTCTVSGNGRMLWTYGHRHANNTRFTMTRIRGTKRDVIYDANNWEHPLLLEFNSITTNRAPDIANNIEGGWNGILDLLTGDKIEWSCDVNNTTDGTLRFTNNTYTGEMCIIDAEAVVSTCQ